MKRLLALVALAALLSTSASCALNQYYRRVSPESPLNLTLESGRPERGTERLFLLGDLVKVIYFENTNHEFVYVPMTLGIDFEGQGSKEAMWTLSDFAILGPSNSPDDFTAVAQAPDYLLLESHRQVSVTEERNHLHQENLWRDYYQAKWLAHRGSRAARQAQELGQLKATVGETEARGYAEVELVLITKLDFFQMGRYYRLDFGPGDGQQTSYVVQVDRNNAVVGVAIGLTIIAVALAASAG